MKICPICRHCYEDTDTTCTQADRSILVPSRPGPRLIGEKYRLDKLLGTGGMGAVYAGLHVELERPTAIKLLLPDLVSDQQALERFKREGRAAARLNHPNVAGTYDFGTLPSGESYIVMELVEGETLRDYLSASTVLPVREAVLIARQAADGIESAHRGGIVHRDLKPSNIIISRDHHGALLVKVLDFGIAKLKENSASATLASITTAGAIVGTPRYMSPEQCGDREVDARSDIYSLGVILYEMLAGRPPFDSPSAMALALKHIQEQPPPLSEARPDLPAELNRLVMWALAKAPADRPQTAAEFSAALRAAEEPSALSPVAASPVAPPQPSTRRDSGMQGGEQNFRPVSEEPASRGGGSSKQAGDGAPADGGRSEVPAGAALLTNGSAEKEHSTSVSSDENSTYGSPPPKQSRTRVLVFAVASVLAISVISVIIVGWSRNQSPQIISNTNTRPAAVPSPTPSRETQAAGHAQRDTEAQAVSPAKDEAKAPTQTPEREKRVLQSALSGWVTATNARDVNRQLSYYAPRLEVFYLSRNVPRETVLAEKRNTFGQADRVSISVDDVAVEIGREGSTAVMRFRKQYMIEAGGRRRDGEVLQELHWAKTNSGWKITSERDLQVFR
ncbi:MAG TPA: protein kinase [Pyrinomonadaceae bacterium]|jgi:serine/threonine protein kinase/ketosteroid isomerase-like protein